MADISTFDNFFDNFPPKSGFQTKKAQHGAGKAQRHIKKSEIASEVKPESKYFFHALLSLMANVIIQTCLRVMFLAADFVLLSDIAFFFTMIPHFKPLFLLFPT